MMSDSLRQQTAKSLLWSGIDKVGVQIIAFVVGIVTARLLTPKDFGLIGALAVFTILSNTIIESGFTAALVRREHNTKGEYTATLCVNILLSLVLYLILFFCAPLISRYFRMPELSDLSRFLFVATIINSLGLVQNTILVKNLEFRKITRINLLSVSIAGLATIALIIFCNLSYWALAWQQVLQTLLKTILLWLFGERKVIASPQFKVIKELFSFSLILLLTSIITALVRYIYNIIIGRIYHVEELGYYSQAYKYQQIPSAIISGTLASVAYPVLAKLNNDHVRQLIYYRKMVRIAAFWTFPLLLGLFAVADDFITILLSEKWLPAVPYFQLLLLAGIFYPFHTLALNILTIRGLPRWNFRLEMCRNALVVIMLLLFHNSIMKMLLGFFIAELISLLIDALLVSNKCHYRVWQQLWDIFPYLAVSLLMVFIVWTMRSLPLRHYIIFPLQIIVGATFYLLTLHLLGSKLLHDTLQFFKRQ